MASIRAVGTRYETQIRDKHKCTSLQQALAREHNYVYENRTNKHQLPLHCIYTHVSFMNLVLGRHPEYPRLGCAQNDVGVRQYV